MTVHALAGKPAPESILVDVPRLIESYYALKPDPADSHHRVAFGTSGHRGTSLKNTFNENHILAITQAICDFRRLKNLDGPLFLGMDTHALSEAAHATAVEVLAANEVQVLISEKSRYTPTPVISNAILTFNRGRTAGLADGIVITPSHNPPEDGGFKYNSSHGGPADSDITQWIENRANSLLGEGNKGVSRIPEARALASGFVQKHDFIGPYVRGLKSVVDMDAISSAQLKIGVDPMGGAGAEYWEPIADYYRLDVSVVNERIDPTFRFMTVDRDGKIRMDCSSPYAMARLIELRDDYDIAFGNDPDFDRHGIVTRTAGLLEPNRYLAAAIWHLFQNRRDWPSQAAVGKTAVSSSLIDRVAARLGRKLLEVPVGFKWFVDGLLSGSCGFGGEESAGASFLRRDGGPWTTDKDGFILDLLAAEITARSGRDLGEHCKELERLFGSPVYERLDAAATPAQKAALKNLSPERIAASQLAGEKITAKLTRAPGNGASLGGFKVVAENGWFAARPSGTEDIYKIYAESFLGEDHLRRIQREAQAIVQSAFG